MFRVLIRKTRTALRLARMGVTSWRYAVTGNGLRFVVQTLKELPAQPPAGRGLLVFFSHFDPHDEVDEYVRYYVEKLYELNATIIFVSGSANLKAESAKKIEPFCVGMYTRKTLSLDFGSSHLAWVVMQQKGWKLEDFDRLVLANDSVYGPLFDLKEMFASFTNADMYGALENLEIAPHLQSFFLAWDLNERSLRFLDKFWKNFRYIVNRDRLIRIYEVGLSELARKQGLRLKAYISAADAQRAAKELPYHQHAEKLAAGPASYVHWFWDGLIEELRFPLLKTNVARVNFHHNDRVADLPQIIANSTEYPYELIEGNLARLNMRGSKQSKQAK